MNKNSPWQSRDPIRAELFSVERLEEHARSLAVAQVVTQKPDEGLSLAGRLTDNASVLFNTHRSLVKAADDNSVTTPASEWLIDNYHLVERQIHDVLSDLPPRYYRQLPKLADGPFRGYPRILGVAWAFVAHTDSRFDPDMLCRFVRAYQEVQPLTIGELWALAITLRIVLIENLRRLAEGISRSRSACRKADNLANRLLGVGRAPEPLPAKFKYGQAPLSESFAVQLVYRLRDQDPRVTPALTWLEQRLLKQGATMDGVVQDEHQKQGAANITVRNIITSMRLIFDVDWTELVERISFVDDILAADTAFRDMDFPTRNLYRNAIEDLARGSNYTEIEVAHLAVKAAKDGALDDPGYYLIAQGRRAFEKTIRFRAPLRKRLERLDQFFGIGGYAASIGLIAAIFLSVPVLALVRAGLAPFWICILGVFGVMPAIDVAIAIVNRAVIWSFGAALLPALHLRDGIPAELRTIVAVPMLLTSRAAIEEQIERLEVHYFASPGAELVFALLSDWVDAPTREVEGDTELLAIAMAGIARLNRQHGPANSGDRFLLLHRARVWNEGERRWIGWERKRGKLHELNRLLRGADDTTFISSDGQKLNVPQGVRYVVTLDADTKLPRDTVRRLIGKMAHPLNRPCYDATIGRVVGGYAVMQPRVTPSLPMGNSGSLFQRTFSSMSGIDSYVSAVSDVYQDLFGEGSYAGKGIYEIDPFEAALAGRVPDSTLLSHDLFEGIFANAGLASDVEVIEEFPSRYDVDALRHHRWARGDWQLLPWILGVPPAVEGKRKASPIPAVGRWKMLDNLRRTLVAPSMILALFAAWALPLADARIWSEFVLATIVAPTILPLGGSILPRRRGVTLDSHLRAFGGDVRLALTQSFLRITLMAHQAWLMSDAIVRTLARLFITRRHLLEWVTAAQASTGAQAGIGGFYRRMAGALCLAVLGLADAVLFGRETWPLAAGLGALWIASPIVARWISLPSLLAGEAPLFDSDAHSLRLTARRTWRFFETFVTPSDHMLPPDNFQEDPLAVLAHRTSPTNIGLYLLSAAAARDFGWMGSAEAVTRIEKTFVTLASLDCFRGHFYNWYDTQDLRPLDPRYVSSVDSGNLAGHLIALANAFRDWRAAPALAERQLGGIMDALDLARDEASRLNDGRRTQTVTWSQLDGALSTLAESISRPLVQESIAARLSALAALAETAIDIARALANERGDQTAVDMLYWVEAAKRSIDSHRQDLDAQASIEPRLLALEAAARGMALAMEFGFMFEPSRKLLSIGYLVAEDKLDPSCYDLLASEARLASFFAIAKGDIPARHWFRLGRSVTTIAHGAALISWSGSMFEYLMPSLVMRAPPGSLIEQTSRLIVKRQMDYAAKFGVPWGISESAYNARDLELTYQYSNFGIPGLGLKRGLGDNLVVAPYATALAAMVDPSHAALNLARLKELGGRGRFGFYEALDYTPARLPTNKTVAVVRAFMAHHQGMTIVAIADTVLDGIMRTRFHAEPMIQATELLLQERTPRDVMVARPGTLEARPATRQRNLILDGGRRFTSAQQSTPATHLLSNGRYTTMLTAAGSGYSRWKGVAVTRWREDATLDDLGSYIYLRDTRSGEVWSAGFQPVGAEPEKYAVSFSEDRAEIVRQDGTLTTTLEVFVSGENDAEVRRVSILNSGSRTRECDITSYAEIVLAPQSSDVSHPAFSKLFVETGYLADIGALTATRRRRAPDEAEIWAAHLAVTDGETVGDTQYETDRGRFIGRGHSVRTSIAAGDGQPLSNTTGPVLDPVFALRRRVRIPAGGVIHVDFWTIVAPSREMLIDTIDKHRDTTAFGRAATFAWTQAQVQLYHLGITADEASLFQNLAGHLVYTAPVLRPPSETIRRGGGGQQNLWAHGISGDLPIVLLRIADTEHLNIVRQLLQAHEYWCMKQLAVDLVILNERQSSYTQDLQIAIETLVRTSQARRQTGSDKLGQVFVLRADLIPPASTALLSSVARIVLIAQRGSLFDQFERSTQSKGQQRLLPRRNLPEMHRSVPLALPQLEFFNGLGGFAGNGTEYVTILGAGQSTPAPWINVIANPSFGFQVAAEGSGYTWSVNSRENQLTPWSNDPVCDKSGEAFYLRDQDSGTLWSPTALPIRDEAATYIARHGRGYSRFEHAAHGIKTDLLQYVAIDAPIKISRLVITNQTARTRHLSVASYVEWVLGPSRGATLPYVTTEIDSITGAMLARNPWNGDFGSRVAFMDLRGLQSDWTGDRREFIGRNGTLANPAGIASGMPLSRIVGAGLDPCGAMRTNVKIAPYGSVEIVCFLGEAENANEAQSLIAQYQTTDLDVELAKVTSHWENILGKVQVKTPDRATDIMLNGWLLYQTLACRVWARSAFYQASGAYGFRDQLQDGMALTPLRPDFTREHLLRAAARQFIEGDVQHWWLPHSGQGVRTRISDDRSWLAYTAAHYVAATGDAGVLDEAVPFLEGPLLQPGQHDNFFHPSVSGHTASLFEHCALALDQSLKAGAHGLPLMGTGDWNDGMNRVGENGTGESVWLGWLLYSALQMFLPLAEARHETKRVAVWRGYAASLQIALEREAWDGDWYKRAFFDDGTPLGTSAGDECRIDSIAQSWAVLSGAADPERAALAMGALERNLIRSQDGVALLFTPAFDKTLLEPGYIKGYPPGIRENGGQYTHAATWSIMAFAALGEGGKAVDLFSLLNPINHALNRADVHRYKVEPYVLAADVYSVAPHVGRGGWTWYTGSAGWMQRAGLESILGLRQLGEFLYLNPCIPKAWPGFEVSFRHGRAIYKIEVQNAEGAGTGIASATMDGEDIPERPLRLKLVDDGGVHAVVVRLEHQRAS